MFRLVFAINILLYIHQALGYRFYGQKWVYDRKINGHTLAVTRTLTKEACKSQCEYDIRCKGATWQGSGTCALKDVISTMVQHHGIWAIVIADYDHINNTKVDVYLSHLDDAYEPPAGNVYIFDQKAPTVQLVEMPTDEHPRLDVWNYWMHAGYGHGDAAAVYWRGEVHLYGGRQYLSNRLEQWTRHDAYAFAPQYGGFGQWRRVAPDLPTPRTGHFAAIFKDYVYVCGCGLEYASGHCEETCDTHLVGTDDAWVTIQIPVCAKKSAASALDPVMFVSGGACRGRGSEFFMFNATTNDWTRLSDLPQARFGHGSTVLHHNLYVCGGSDGQLYLDSCDVFNLHSNRWQPPGTVNPMRMARYSMELIAHGPYLYAFGGSQNGFHKTGIIERYDFEWMEWTEVRVLMAYPTDTATAILVPH